MSALSSQPAGREVVFSCWARGFHLLRDIRRRRRIQLIPPLRFGNLFASLRGGLAAVAILSVSLPFESRKRKVLVVGSNDRDLLKLVFTSLLVRLYRLCRLYLWFLRFSSSSGPCNRFEYDLSEDFTSWNLAAASCLEFEVFHWRLEPYDFKFTVVTLNHFDVMTNPVSCQQLLKFSHFVLNREAVLKFSTYELL